jgi:hypothetical protein
VLADAASLGLLDLPLAIAKLRQTSFRASPSMMKLLLDEYSPGPR